MALSALTYENLIEMFSHSNVTAYMANTWAREIIALAERNHDLNTHMGRVNFAKDNADIRQHILDGRIVAAVKFLWDQRNSGAWCFGLKEAKDAVYEAYADDPAYIAANR